MEKHHLLHGHLPWDEAVGDGQRRAQPYPCGQPVGRQCDGCCRQQRQPGEQLSQFCGQAQRPVLARGLQPCFRVFVACRCTDLARSMCPGSRPTLQVPEKRSATSSKLAGVAH